MEKGCRQRILGREGIVQVSFFSVFSIFCSSSMFTFATILLCFDFFFLFQETYIGVKDVDLGYGRGSALHWLRSLSGSRGRRYVRRE